MRIHGYRYILHVGVMLMFFLKLSAQEIPPIDVFTPKDYKGAHQNWQINQANDNTIYVANNNGLLEFDGAIWRLYTKPFNNIFRSLEIVNDKIYTGGQLDFGVWTRNSYGVLEYESIVSNYSIELLEDEEFWNIIEQDGWLLFQSTYRIYIINLEKEEYKLIESDTPISRMIKTDGKIFFQKENLGLFIIENGEAIPFSLKSEFINNELINIFSNNERLSFLTSSGLFYYNPDGELSPWSINSSLPINKNTIYSGIQLRKGGYVIGTISNGAILLNENGDFQERFNRSNGLSNNTILSAYEDKNSNVWLGLDIGINNINLSSRFKVFLDEEGSIGSVYASIAHNGYLYLGTNQGLFVRERDSSNPFELIQDTQGQVWQLRIIDDILFCGHNEGTFLINGLKVIKRLTSEPGTWNFKFLDNTTSPIIQGSYSGLNVLVDVVSGWTFGKKLSGFDISSRFYEFYEDKLYVNHEYKGFYRLELDDELNITQVEKVDNVGLGQGSSIFKQNNTLYYASSNGVFKYSAQQQEFLLDKEFSSLFSSFNSLSTIMPVHGEENVFWRYADDNIALLKPGSISNQPQLELIPISPNVRTSVLGFENMTKIDNNEYLIGGSDGYIILNLNGIDENKTPLININSIQAHKINQPPVNLLLDVEAELPANQNNIEFLYSIPYHGKLSNVKYQYKLDGLSDKWSAWLTDTSQLFDNLPFGDYTFNVRGKIGNSITTNTASFKFKIDRPLLISNTFILLYIITFLTFVFIMHRVYRRYYKRKHEKLIAESEKEFEIQRLEKDQKIIQLNNERLKVDIESKNRELATSTMNLIRRNEFLNEIKKSLSEIQSIDNIGVIIKTIDKSMESNDDWKLFEEAFNNADKDFLKVLKENHPNLTHNDLRLCAYLRLNLSSKEIAPLLNISYRSVEVKRYRLRKKIGLDHEDNLTNYILEL